jgi:putative DNA primase/helicase
MRLRPAAVLDATADYMAGEDAIGRWLEDGCIGDEDLWTSGAELFLDYRAWCERMGEKPMSPKRLTQTLGDRGFVPRRTSSARGFSGIGLRRGMTHVTDRLVIPVTSARERPI